MGGCGSLLPRERCRQPGVGDPATEQTAGPLPYLRESRLSTRARVLYLQTHDRPVSGALSQPAGYEARGGIEAVSLSVFSRHIAVRAAAGILTAGRLKAESFPQK